MWVIVVHGGAGRIPEELRTSHQEGCARAAERGAAQLEAGADAVEAVCSAVRVLEDDPLYNAGRGAALDGRGLAALDAAVMRGADLAFGGVGALVGARNPVDVARAVLEDGRHCLLVGPSAAVFGRGRGLRFVSPDHLVTERTKASFEAKKRHAEGPEVVAANLDVGNTVGAVALDVWGHLAAATSTGGLLLRTPGRVGDTPIPGAGTYARDDLGAASATGHGETMMRTVFAFQALCDLDKSPDRPPEEVLLDTLAQAKRRAGGTGGIIALRPDGTVGFARNAPHMGVAWLRAGEPIQTTF